METDEKLTGAIEWIELLSRFNLERPCRKNWRPKEWIGHLTRGSSPQRFQFCLDPMTDKHSVDEDYGTFWRKKDRANTARQLSNSLRVG